jgi:hypothetical protein
MRLLIGGIRAVHEVTLFASEFPNCRKEEVVDGVRIVRAGGKCSVYWRAKKYYRTYFSKESNLSQIYRRCC